MSVTTLKVTHYKPADNTPIEFSIPFHPGCTLEKAKEVAPKVSERVLDIVRQFGSENSSTFNVESTKSKVSTFIGFKKRGRDFEFTMAKFLESQITPKPGQPEGSLEAHVISKRSTRLDEKTLAKVLCCARYLGANDQPPLEKGSEESKRYKLNQVCSFTIFWKGQSVEKVMVHLKKKDQDYYIDGANARVSKCVSFTKKEVTMHAERVFFGTFVPTEDEHDFKSVKVLPPPAYTLNYASKIKTSPADDSFDLVKLEEPKIVTKKANLYPFYDIDLASLMEKAEFVKWLTPKRVKEIFLEIISAIGVMHKQGYCHRDIKPDNIMLIFTCDFEIKQVVLIDTDDKRSFEEVKRLREQAKKTEGFADTWLGTDQYWPKSYTLQIQDQTSDVFAFGILMGSLAKRCDLLEVYNPIAKSCFKKDPSKRTSLKELKKKVKAVTA